MHQPKLNIIVPCYNEEEVLPHSSEVLKQILKDLIDQNVVSNKSQICFIDDGSRDRTLELMDRIQKQSDLCSYISFSRNFGHQAALLAGLFETKADVYITIDSDLQDDPYKIKEMVNLYLQGNDIVYGVRSNRDTDSWFKEKTAVLFYKIQALLGVKAVYNAGDFRLLSARAVEALKSFPEKNLFLRGIIPLLGFKSEKVFYSRQKRTAGTTKYPFFKMFAFALNGVVGFSIVPIRCVTILGLCLSLLGFLLLIWSLYQYMVGQTIHGWTSLFTLMALFNGIVLFALGVIGEYIAKIFIEVKNRPNYIIAQKENLK